MSADFTVLWHAYGPATEVPGWLADVTLGGRAARRGLRELWGTVVRQDAVYSCTPAVVPFLADVVADDGAEPAVRAEVALMLAQIAANGVPSDAPDLAGRARSAVAAEFHRLLHPLARGPAAVRAALVAVCATVPGLPARAVLLLDQLTGSPDRELADAARVALLLAGGRITGATLDALTDPGFPDEREPPVRAAAFVRDRCLLAVARALPVSPERER
jgi:hypothetical protein